MRTSLLSTTKLLHSNANQRAEEGTDGSNELRGHGGALGKARLHEQRKVADLVGDFVEKDCDSGGGADGGRGVETGRHGEAICDVVCEVGTANNVVVTNGGQGKKERSKKKKMMKKKNTHIRFRYPPSFTLGFTSFFSVAVFTTTSFFPFFLALTCPSASPSAPVVTAALFSSTPCA